MRPVTPAERKEIERRLAAGEPLPPGFQALPEGQAPPPGMMPTGVTTNADGQPIQSIEDLTSHNPIVADAGGLALMRNQVQCPLPKDSTQLQSTIQMLAAVQGMDDEVIDVIARGLAAYMVINNYCGEGLKDRVAVDFSKDEELVGYHKTIHDCTAEMQELQKQMQDCHTKAKKAIEARWAQSVKKYGLNPKTNFYAINEGEGVIYQLHIDCTVCKGRAKLRKSRQEADEFLKRVQAKKRKEAEASAKPAPPKAVPEKE